MKDGLDIMIYLGENNSGGEPSLPYCEAYAAEHNIPLNKIFIDYGQYGAWQILFTNLNIYSSPDGSFGVPWDAVLDGSNMEYVYTSGYTDVPYASASAAVDALLAQ